MDHPSLRHISILQVKLACSLLFYFGFPGVCLETEDKLRTEEKKTLFCNNGLNPREISLAKKVKVKQNGYIRDGFVFACLS